MPLIKPQVQIHNSAVEIPNVVVLRFSVTELCVSSVLKTFEFIKAVPKKNKMAKFIWNF